MSDATARDAVRGDLHRTLLVEAGAGTGKTTALVERLLSLVASGVELRHVAAITFTEAAAAELRDRVRAALEERGEVTALAQLDEAALGTLHGFAQRILAEHALAAGLPPEIEVLDDVEAGVEREEAWRAFLGALLDDADLEAVLRRGFQLGLQPGQLRAIALRFHEHWDRLADAELDPVGESAVDREAVLGPLRAALLVPCRDDDDRLKAHCDRLRSVGGLLAESSTDDDFLRLLATAGNLRAAGNAGRADAWDGRKDEVVSLLCAADDAAKDLLRSAREAVLAELLPRLRGFVLDEAARRRRDGRLEFHDLLVLARDLVRDDDRVRERLRARWERILLDEFQDTDPIQLELVSLLAPGQGRLFFVGDPKQSIYRFRRADIATYLGERDRHGGDILQLTRSFRSVPSIVRWVNDVFGALIVEGDAGSQPPYEPLEAAREEAAAPEPPAVVVLGGPDGSGARVRDIRREEAADVARTLRRARDESWPVGEPPRAIRYADMAVLIPTRTSLGVLERALDAEGVPYRVDSRSLVWSTQEVRDLVSALRAIEDPEDEVAVVATLRSPALGCRDDELAAFRLAGGRFDPRREPPEGVDPAGAVASGLAWLAGLHADRWRHTASELLARIVEERRVDELALVHRRPRDHQRRVAFLLDQARAFVDAGGRRTSDFVAWAEQQAAEGAAVNEAVVPEPDDDAVRILTVHGAKGLEFGLVALSGLNARAPAWSPEVLWDAAGRPHVGIGAKEHRFATRDYEDALTAERTFERAEAIRLLYVAATRARDHLVVSLHHKAGEPCGAARLHERCDVAPELWRRAGDTASSPAAASDDGGPPAADAAAETDVDVAGWAEARAALVASSATAPVVAATALARDGGSVGGGPGSPDEPWRRGRAGTAIGRAVHAVLQSADLHDPSTLDGLAAAQAAAEGVADRAGEVAATARAAIASEPVQAAIAGRHWRELFVAAELDGVTVEGFVDLLYESGGGVAVVDYKTDAVDEGGLDTAVEHYRLQGGAYAAVVEEAIGRPVARMAFVFATPDGARVRDLPDLAAAVADVRQALAARRTSAA